MLIVLSRAAFAQEDAKYQAILERLDALEKQNAALVQEIHSLRETIRAEQQSQKKESEETKERAEIDRQRIADQEQAKIGASQRYPISLTGMLLFDAYNVSGTNSSSLQTRASDYSSGAPGGGATLNQSIIGLNFHGPEAFGAKIAGSMSMDFYTLNGNDALFRFRRGNVSFDWPTRTLLFGQEKPLIAPYEPTSFARVGVPPLAGAGNLWLWTPQVRYEERFKITPLTTLSLQGAVLATYEDYDGSVFPSAVSYSPIRPAGEIRASLTRKWGDQTLFAIGAGAHAGESHVNGVSVPSRVVSADFKLVPARWLEITGTVLHGSDFADLGGLPTAVSVTGSEIKGVRGNAGWLQLAFPLTSRLTLDLYGGRQSNFARDLTGYQIAGNSEFAGNILYRIAPNVVLGFEGSHQVMSYLEPYRILENRYDATLAYLF